MAKQEKYLVSIEFRYNQPPKYEDDYTFRSKKITIGVYNTFDEACEAGNEFVENLEGKFALHQFPDGSKAKKERFSKNGGCFGSKNTLITNLAYLKTPFEFYAKITTLNYEDINVVINEVVESAKKYKEYKKAGN